ncbi:hypothetical protein [Rhodoferax antarcticus]|nr:hypothetical protein [Rhodoferax antarcticus]MCW2311154.1 hypothetical protein [Rhodoferax antarcticus]
MQKIPPLPLLAKAGVVWANAWSSVAAALAWLDLHARCAGNARDSGS